MHRITACLLAGWAATAAAPPPACGSTDLELTGLTSLVSLGRVGTYPAGRNGFSCETTCCNVGDVAIAWKGPGGPGELKEEHPCLGLAMYRVDAGGTLEMIGTSWMKHVFALSGDQCDTTCTAVGESLGVGCSDVYTAGTNGNRYFLGPRDEVDPHTAEWEGCGSYFDGSPEDCFRSYFGSEPTSVDHRLEVLDADLDVSGASFFYEAVFTVAGDADLVNSAGWQECWVSWTGSSWNAVTVGGAAPQPGPRILTWGDHQGTTSAPLDGQLVLAVRVEDLGGGTWHYDYALFNWTSARGVGSLEIPVGGAAVTNLEFRDTDTDPANDWTGSVSGGVARWTTSDSPLRYQTLFNFRFDADVPPVSSEAALGIFDPGPGSVAGVDTRAPSGAVTSVAFDPSAPMTLLVEGPNPFADATRVAWHLDRAGRVDLRVVDISGRAVRTLTAGLRAAGPGSVTWDGRDDRGSPVPAGVYFVRLAAGGVSRTVKASRVR